MLKLEQQESQLIMFLQDHLNLWEKIALRLVDRPMDLHRLAATCKSLRRMCTRGKIWAIRSLDM